MDDIAAIVITDVVEHEDGSATYTFDLPDRARDKLANLGLELVLHCGAYDVDIADALDNIKNISEKS